METAKEKEKADRLITDRIKELENLLEFYLDRGGPRQKIAELQILLATNERFLNMINGGKLQ